jgi:hypothetical protein
MFEKDVKQFKVSTIVFAAAVVFLIGAVVQAQVIVDGKGFEAPDYSTLFSGTGELEGQQGWIRTSGPALSTAFVQTAIVHSGSQAVQVNRAANSDDRWAVPVTGYPSQPTVLISWDMRVEGPEGGAFGPFFGVEAYDDSGGFGLLGSLGVDATTADVLYQSQDTGFLTETGTTVNFGAWNHFDIKLDYSVDEYTVYMNGTPLATTGFVDRSLGLDDFTDANIAAISAAGDSASQALTGTAYFDNFLVMHVEADPEPVPPVAEAVGPYTLWVGDPLILSATGSTPGDWPLASYMWDLDDDGIFETDAGNQQFLIVDYNVIESLGLAVGGVYDIHLKVTDTMGVSDTDSSVLRIVPEPATMSLLALGGIGLIHRKRK